MATQQVKFYSMTSASYGNVATKDPGGIYFIEGGELYKGSERFGLGRVTIANSTTGVTGMKRGDIVVTGSGAGWVFDGTNWQSIGGDINSLQTSWRADISTWTKGLVSTAQGDGTYIKQITQDDEGKVSAVVSTFATDVKTAVGNGSASGAANGITVSVVTTSGSVTSVEVAADNLDVTSISATTGSFGTIYLGDPATSVNKIVTSIGPATGDGAATDAQLPTALAVAKKLATLDNAMHFAGVVTSLPASAEAGDIVVVGANPTGDDPDGEDLVTGQEYIYDGTKWEIIGDQSAQEAILGNKVQVGTGEAAGSHGISASFSLKSNSSSHEFTVTVDAISTSNGIVSNEAKVVTAGAVADFVPAKIGEIVTGGTSTVTDNTTGVALTVGTDATASVTTLSITGLGTAASKAWSAETITAGGTDLPTQGAVYTAISAAIQDLDSTATTSAAGKSATGVSVTVNQVDGKVTTADAQILWCDANGVIGLEE